MDVLVYLDPSPRGEWALAAAAQLPPRWKGRLRLLATEEDAAADPSLSTAPVRGSRTAARSRP